MEKQNPITKKDKRQTGKIFTTYNTDKCLLF